MKLAEVSTEFCGQKMPRGQRDHVPISELILDYKACKTANRTPWAGDQPILNRTRTHSRTVSLERFERGEGAKTPRALGRRTTVLYSCRHPIF
jgi:hypothetical protein